ncbi:MAG: glutamate racemase [Roseiflexaceae bacterium]|nr:glutamate racemase [Roseiflexaceae bacterium]
MIALFDSGLGGLSVLREVRAQLPAHDLAYFADSAFCPYGPRSIEWVRERSLAIGLWLVERGARLLVVACNTASSAALESLRAALPIPVVGMEPGLKPAVAATRSGRIGVLATVGTLQSQRFAQLVARFGHKVQVIVQPCHGWVEQVEMADLASQQTQALVAQYVVPLVAQGIDTLVLGCTHYPFLRPLIEQAAGPGATLIDTGPAVARRVAQLARAHDITAGGGGLCAYTSGDPAVVAPAIERLLGMRIGVARAAL